MQKIDNMKNRLKLYECPSGITETSFLSPPFMLHSTPKRGGGRICIIVGVLTLSGVY